MAGTTGIYWVRNDLRLDDNDPLLTALADHERVVVVYYLDERHFRQLATPDIRKTGPYRVAFLLEALTDLRQSLRSIGGDLTLRWGDDPAAAIAKLVAATQATDVYVQREVTREEVDDEIAVAAALPPECTLHTLWGKTLYHADDLPFDPRSIPEPFRNFRKPLEKEAVVREPLAAPTTIRGVDIPPGELPTPEELGYPEVTLVYPGGESAGRARLAYYLDESHLIANYRRTRNLSLGGDYSSKFSAYLALGCLSPRRVHAEVIRYGKDHKNYGGSSLLFEMRWRDFFIYQAWKHGDAIFLPGGFKRRTHDWSYDTELFQRWCSGRTGIPFVDAHMRELDATGFMSNRGRVNCASFLTRDYRIDWRWGAAWFENRLIDYEVCANWLNWHTQALEIYYTSPPWQGLKYDKDGSYVKTWLPELDALPAPLVHAPWKMEAEGMLDAIAFDLDADYHRPQTTNSKWDWAWERIKKGDSSSPRRKKKKS
ncbi:Cryptochrome DASH [Neolewinella maritima]|uniref:Cryptochrome DASH n=1 Tax=Neolewinella maritima TaxID=1383882 RepID=A0ABM9B211_9BACT|nr:DASH family cryptochrome [Neolewinella maritima]CAH1001379.1 Cryptochrome DASH [Neolewinella maritima]